ILYYDKATQLFEKQLNDIELAKIDLDKGKIALAQNDRATAKRLFDQALKVAESNNDVELLINTLNELSLWYEISGSPTESLKAIRKSINLKDSLEAINRNQQFSQTLMEFEIGRKDLAIAELNAQQLLRQEQLKNEEFLRNVLVVILAFTAVLLFTLYRNSVKSKKTNEMLVEHQKEIEAKSRELQSLLSMKDKFFSIVSHDLRSPINGLVGILDMLDDGYITQEELVKVTVSLRGRLGSTSKMLDNLLDWALVEMNEITLKWEEINLNKVAEDNLMSFKDINEKNVRFVNKIKPHVRVKADRNMLDLILRNLIANSVKFTENGGEVTLSAVKAENHKFTVKVTDNGVGMNADQLNKIFDTSALYTTRGTANEKGTGLGLKLCKEFVEKMGGTIWVESEEGKGSTFNFTLQNPDKK
ncbi:MAG: HAMP domain-containing sensor histidine kinase, partial [Bacteroidota bacterium]